MSSQPSPPPSLPTLFSRPAHLLFVPCHPLFTPACPAHRTCGSCCGRRWAARSGSALLDSPSGRCTVQPARSSRKPAVGWPAKVPPAAHRPPPSRRSSANGGSFRKRDWQTWTRVWVGGSTSSSASRISTSSAAFTWYVAVGLRHKVAGDRTGSWRGLGRTRQARVSTTRGLGSTGAWIRKKWIERGWVAHLIYAPLIC